MRINLFKKINKLKKLLSTVWELFSSLLPVWSFVFVLFWGNSVFYSNSSPCSDWHWFEALRNIKICRLCSSFISSRGDDIHCQITAYSVLLLFSFTRTHLYLCAIVFPPNFQGGVCLHLKVPEERDSTSVQYFRHAASITCSPIDACCF